MSAGLVVLLLALPAAAETPAAAAVDAALSRVAAIVASEKDQDARVVAAADRRADAVFLGLSGLGRRAVEPLAAAAADPRRPEKVRLFAVVFLSRLADPAAYAPLSRLLLDADAPLDVRSAAAQGLAALDLPPEAARRTFCAALGQKDLPRGLEEDVLIPLERLGCADPAPLVVAARAFGPRPAGRDLATARRALRALGRSRGEAPARALLGLALYFPPRAPARAAAIAALGEKRADAAAALPETPAVLSDVLREETDEPASMLILVRLADACGPRTRDLLVPLARHPDAEVLVVAAESLARLQAVEALPDLEAVLAGALKDPRFSPKDGRPDPAVLLARLETVVASLRRAREGGRGRGKRQGDK